MAKGLDLFKTICMWAVIAVVAYMAVYWSLVLFMGLMFMEGFKNG